MDLLAQKHPESTTLGKNRLDLDGTSETDALERKRPHLGPPPGLTPCLQPLSVSLPGSDQDLQVSQIGPYILLEATEGARRYRAVNRQTEKEYTCKVYAVENYPKVLAPYRAVPGHPNIARMADVIVGDRNVYVFFEAGQDDMHNYVRRNRRLVEHEAAALFRQMAEAIAHCHQHGVVLRDLKLSKFVFVNRERSKLMLENLEDVCVLNGPDDSLEDRHGCPAYVGPEILRSSGSYSGKGADVWSLGVALYTMLVGRYPFQGTKPASLFGKIRRGHFALPESLSPKARYLLRCLLRKDPAQRLMASEILLHPWLAAGDVLDDLWQGSFGHQRLDQVVPEAEKSRVVAEKSRVVEDDQEKGEERGGGGGEEEEEGLYS